MNEDIIVYAKRDEYGSIINIISSVFLKDTQGFEEVDRWVEGQDRQLYTACDNGHYVYEKHGKRLFDEYGRPNYHGDWVEWTEEEKKEKYPTTDDEKAVQEEKLNNMMLMSMRTSFLNEMPDEQAVEIHLMFASWNDYEDGYTFKVDERVEYNGGLWKVKKEHQKQASWYPGADPTLFVQLDKDEHKGTLEDPIPVPSSVTTSGFEYVVGKYYLEGEDIYLCKRQGMEDGETIQLYFAPSSLVGQYFEKV